MIVSELENSIYIQHILAKLTFSSYRSRKTNCLKIMLQIYKSTYLWMDQKLIFSCRLAGKLWSSILLSSFSLSLSLDNVYPLASYEYEWHNSFDQSYMLDLVQTFSNLFKVVQTCSNLFKTALFCSNLFKHAQTCFDQSYMFDLVQTFSNLFQCNKTCSKLF